MPGKISQWQYLSRQSLLLLLLRLVHGVLANDEYDRILQTLGEQVVCDEKHRLPSHSKLSDRSSCEHLCTSNEECGIFVLRNGNQCRIYSACNSTRSENQWVTAEIYKRRWADLTVLSDACTGNDCQVAVKCPHGYWPIQCEMMAASDGLKKSNGVFFDEDTCFAKGASSGGSEIHARLTCRRNQQTFIVLSDLIYLDQQLVVASCPVGSTAISCNCVTSLAADGCRGKFTFAPIRRMCALDIRKFPESSELLSTDGKGAKVTAICSYFATCQSYDCPSGYILKSNAAKLVCASEVCNSADVGNCCTPASCSMQRQLNDFNSIAAMTSAGWEFHLDNLAAFDNQSLKLWQCSDALQTDSYYGFDQGDVVLSLELIGAGALSLHDAFCEADRAPDDLHKALEVWLNGNLAFSSAWQAGLDFQQKVEAGHGYVPIRYSDRDVLRVKGIGRNTGILMRRLQFACPAPVSPCERMGGVDCSGELRAWAEGNMCVANVPTSGATCAEYCAQRRLSCVKGMDNDGTKCGLNREGHLRQTDEHNGCLQRWADQICVCTHQSVRFPLDLRKLQVVSPSANIPGRTFSAQTSENPVSCRFLGKQWWQIDLGAQYYIERIHMITMGFTALLVKVDNVTCATVTGRNDFELACGSFGKNLRVVRRENSDELSLCNLEIGVVLTDAEWLDLSRMPAKQSSLSSTEDVDAQRAVDGNVASENKCTRIQGYPHPWWQIDLMNAYHILAVQVVGEFLHRFHIHVDQHSRCAGPERMVQANSSKVVQCNAVGKNLTLSSVNEDQYSVNEDQYMILCEISIAVEAADLQDLQHVSASLEDLQWPCSAQKRAAGLLARFPLRSDIDQSGIFLDVSLKHFIDDRFKASEMTYTEQEIYFCIAECRKRVACLRVLLMSGECLLYSEGVNLSIPTYSPIHQPTNSQTQHTTKPPSEQTTKSASICWAEHFLCHAEDSRVCNPEVVSTVIMNSFTVVVPLSESALALESDLSVWQSGIAVAYQDIKMSWVNIFKIDILSRRLHQQRRLASLLKQEILVEYEIVVPLGSAVPSSGPSSKHLESAFKSQSEFEELDLKVASVQEGAVIDRNPHAVVEDAPSNAQSEAGLQETLIILIVAVIACSLALFIAGWILFIRHHRKKMVPGKIISVTPVGRPSIEFEADMPELDVATMEVLPSSWTRTHTHPSKSFDQLVLVSSEQYHVFKELLNSTYRPFVSQDRPCPKPHSKCKKTPGGCPCVCPGGDPGLPVEYVVRRVICMEDSSMWSRYIRKRDLLQSKRQGSGEIEPFDPPVFTNEIARQYPDVLEPLASELNEVYLWHGTHVRAALSIAQNGFNMELAGSGAGNMYGDGIYLAESCTKADEYAQHEKGGYYDNIFALVLCRACLGKYYHTVNRQPDAIRHVQSGSFDSVCGDRAKSVKTFREIVVYDPDQAYPEYIVLYSRLHHGDDALKLRRAADVPFHMQLPIYWVACGKDPEKERFRMQYRVRRDTHDLIQQFVSAACSDAGIDDVTLVAARRIEDSQMWINYSHFKRSVNARLQEDLRLSQPNELDGNSQTGHVITASLLRRLGARISMDLGSLDESVNELFLWHGTEASAAEIISQFGFRLGERVHGHRFGKGIYLTEDLKKSLSYAPIDTVGSNTVHHVLLCRAVCGDIFYTEQDIDCSAHQEARSKRKDCILAHPGKRGPREFILLDDIQVYPEFILELEGRPGAYYIC